MRTRGSTTSVPEAVVAVFAAWHAEQARRRRRARFLARIASRIKLIQKMRMARDRARYEAKNHQVLYFGGNHPSRK